MFDKAFRAFTSGGFEAQRLVSRLVNLATFVRLLRAGERPHLQGHQAGLRQIVSIQNRWESKKGKSGGKDSCLPFITADHLTFTDLSQWAWFPPIWGSTSLGNTKPQRLRTLHACAVGRKYLLAAELRLLPLETPSCSIILEPNSPFLKATISFFFFFHSKKMACNTWLTV